MIAVYALLWLWNAPQVIIGAALAVAGRPYASRWRDGRLEVSVRWIAGYATTTGQTWGRIILFKASPPGASVEVHELNHAMWCDRLGPLWIPAYVGASLISWVRGTGIYEGNYFEVTARRAAGQ